MVEEGEGEGADGMEGVGGDGCRESLEGGDRGEVECIVRVQNLDRFGISA